MTKINKLGKSTFVIAILSFLLVAVLAFGGTYAYFSAVSGKAAGQVKTGHLKLNATGDAITSIDGWDVDSTIAQPGQLLLGQVNGEGAEVGEAVDATVTTNIAYYLRVKFDVKVDTADGATHNGIIAEDDPYTTGTNEGEDATEADADAAAGNGADKVNIDNQVDVEGDNVSDDLAILDIVLTVAKGAGAAETWVEYIDNGDHTGYFYAATGVTAPTKHAAPAGGTEDFDLTVKINVQDWVGAHGCQYYMDAVVTVRFQVEVLQADYLDATKLDGVTFTGENGVPATIAELHAAWDKAVGLSQD